jgi:Niemann-Pick C1 protein
LKPGTPFTSITPLLPFVILGIGLEDSFIMLGAYDRTDPSKGPKERVYDTIQDVGVSITVSTITTALAFGLGCISSIPTIYWLCLYAFPTVMCVYIYQLTFFVAFIVLDERRIQQRRRNCCTWINVDDDDDEQEEGQEEDISRVGLYRYACVASLSSAYYTVSFFYKFCCYGRKSQYQRIFGILNLFSV